MHRTTTVQIVLGDVIRNVSAYSIVGISASQLLRNLKTIYGDLLKKYLIKNLQPKTLLNIEDMQIFEEATVESNIFILKKDKVNEFFDVKSKN